MIALLMFAAIVLAVLLGYPVAICLGGVALLVGYVTLGPAFMQFLPSRMMGVLTNYVLLAVPMFILMGLTLQRSGLAEVLLRRSAALAGRRSGGLALAVLAVGALLAASTGIVGASVVTLGLIALPVMERSGYAPSVAAGIVASAGSLGQIVPPSIVLILLASVMQVSVGELFASALLPSALLVGAYASYLVARAVVSPSSMPPAVAADDDLPLGQLSPKLASPAAAEWGGGVASREAASAIPTWLGVLGPVVLIAGVLGSILAGIASPTEASGVGAVLSVGLLAMAGRFTWSGLLQIARESLRLTSMVYLILLGATTFALVFRGLGGDDLLVGWVQDAGLSPASFVALLLLVVFVAGFFIDFIEIIFIVVPVVLPIVGALGIDPLWLAVLLGLNLQTSFLTPPFGFSLFYLRGVAPPSVTTAAIYRGVVPYVLIQVALLISVAAFPGVFGFATAG